MKRLHTRTISGTEGIVIFSQVQADENNEPIAVLIRKQVKYQTKGQHLLKELIRDYGEEQVKGKFFMTELTEFTEKLSVLESEYITWLKEHGRLLKDGKSQRSDEYSFSIKAFEFKYKALSKDKATVENVTTVINTQCWTAAIKELLKIRKMTEFNKEDYDEINIVEERYAINRQLEIEYMRNHRFIN